MEGEADILGLELLARAGYSPNAAIILEQDGIDGITCAKDGVHGASLDFAVKHIAYL